MLECLLESRFNATYSKVPARQTNILDVRLSGVRVLYQTPSPLHGSQCLPRRRGDALGIYRLPRPPLWRTGR